MFPWVDGAAIAFVLGEFRVAECVVEMIAERGADDRIVVEFGDRLA